MKIVISSSHGGFNLSRRVREELDLDYQRPRNEDFGIINSQNYHEYRAHPKLIEVLEKLGVENCGSSKWVKLKIVEIPDDVDWYVDEYEGWEVVREKHRSWG